VSPLPPPVFTIELGMEYCYYIQRPSGSNGTSISAPSSSPFTVSTVIAPTGSNNSNKSPIVQSPTSSGEKQSQRNMTLSGGGALANNHTNYPRGGKQGKEIPG